MKKLHRVRPFKNDQAEIISVSTAILGRMHREVIFIRHSIAIIIHFSLKLRKKSKEPPTPTFVYPFLAFGPTSRVPGCAIGTEIHYLFLEVVPNFTTRVITSDNTRTINNLAIYVHKAFKVRNTAFFAGNNTQLNHHYV